MSRRSGHVMSQPIGDEKNTSLYRQTVAGWHIRFSPPLATAGVAASLATA